MKQNKSTSKTSRRDAIKLLGVSSAAIITSGLGKVSSADNIRENGSQVAQDKFGPDDGPNQPIGQGIGIYPGRVVWAWNPDATNPGCTNEYKTGDFYFNKENYNQEVICDMFSDSLKKLTGKKTDKKSWDALFRDFNKRKKGVKKGYTKGEKIYIKLNQTSARGRLTEETRKEGKYHYPAYDPTLKRQPSGVCETAPPVVLAVIRQLVNVCGIKQSDIALGDPQNPLWGHNYDAWFREFPDLVYTDCMNGTFGRTLLTPTADDKLFYGDKSQTDKTYTALEEADYLINIPQLKCHSGAGITITAKNFFGAHARQRSDHFHYTHPTRVKGYKNYRVLVDLMGSKYFGRNSMLCVVEGLWGGGSGEVGPPVRYFMPPFNNNWCNSILISQDQVAIDSVCFDILRNEWNGINKHDPANNRGESTPNVNGVDDYLHQAADSSSWPEGIIYDPDKSGQPLPSLGVHEHWNNATDMHYSRNLGKSNGIELITIPENLGKRS
jgi:hypothetical protein